MSGYTNFMSQNKNGTNTNRSPNMNTVFYFRMGRVKTSYDNVLGGKVARKVCEASREALQGTQPLSRCKACNKLKVGELLSTLNCYNFDQRKITPIC